GDSVTYAITATLKATATGTLTNSASASASNASTASASDSDTITAAGTTLSVTKTDNKGGSSVTASTGSVAAGSQIICTGVVKNTGAAPADPVTITDTLPATDISSDTFSAWGSGSGFTSSGSGAIVDTAVDLPAGDSVTYTITATLKATATGTLTNSASASASNASIASASHSDTITGLFCVNTKGVGTYTQGTVSGIGTVRTVKGTTFIGALGKDLALAGSTNGTKSGFVELAPTLAIGTSTL